MGDESADAAEVRLWNSAITTGDYSDDARRAYLEKVFDQYKLCVEMADRVSARRGLTNTFFLTLNTLILTAIGILWHDKPTAGSGWLIFPLLAALGQCVAWYTIVGSYRRLNAAKYKVVGYFELRLPAFAYSRAEWGLLGGGKDKRKYRSLTRIEQLVPALFGVVYVAGYAALLLG